MNSIPPHLTDSRHLTRPPLPRKRFYKVGYYILLLRTPSFSVENEIHFHRGCE